jgi:hypothetical protein
LRETLTYLAGARGDDIWTRYDDWRATPRSEPRRYWKGDGFGEFQTGLLLLDGRGPVDELNQAARKLHRLCSKRDNPLVAIALRPDGTSGPITNLEWPDLAIIDADGFGPQLYRGIDAMQVALGNYREPAFRNPRFFVADVLRVDAGLTEASSPRPAIEPSARSTSRKNGWASSASRSSGCPAVTSPPTSSPKPWQP